MKFGLLVGVSIWLTACGQMQSASSSASVGPAVTNAPAAATPSGGIKARQMAALGDSITEGYDIAQLLSGDPAMSWSTGASLPASHYNQFRASRASLEVRAQNFAVTGETVLGAASTWLAQASAAAALQPDYVTVELGGNDVCLGHLAASGAAATFQQKITAGLRTLVDSGRAPVVLVASIPNIWQLQNQTQLSNSLICRAVWSAVCPEFSVGEARFTSEWQAANQALQAAASSVGGKVIYDQGAVAAQVFAADDISGLDCFHPSAAGQAKLAASTWPLVSAALF